MKTGPRGFHWMHIPTGKVGASEFTLYHAIEAEWPSVFENTGTMPLEATLMLINKWNAAASTWKYWL